MEESKHIKKLEELIPLLSDITISNSPDVEYDVNNTGTALGFNLYNIPKVAVQRVFMSKGTIFPTHQHEENEYCLIYDGKFELDVEISKLPILIKGTQSNDRILGVGDGVFFSSGTPHGGKMLEDTWIISITIPAGGGYPDGE